MALLKDFKYHRPATLHEALGLLKKAEDPLVLGGGTFVLNYLKKSPKYPTDVVGLQGIEALRGLKDSHDYLSIGSMTTISELAESGLIKDNFPSLFEACGKMATTPIRNMATIGGNLASRFFWADLPAVLISLNASISLFTFNNEERMAVEDFLRSKPLKKIILASIVIPKKHKVGHYFRHTKTMSVDVPSLALAFCCSLVKNRILDAKIIVNTTVSLPLELKVTKALLEGKDPKKIVFNEVKSALKNDTKGTKVDEYRMNRLEVDMENLIELLKK